MDTDTAPTFSPDEPLPAGWIGERRAGGEWVYRHDPDYTAWLDDMFGPPAPDGRPS